MDGIAELLAQFGAWVLSWVEVISGRIDPALKARIGSAVGVASAIFAVVAPFLAMRRAWKELKLWWGGRKILDDGEVIKLVDEKLKATPLIDYDKLAAAMAKQQALASGRAFDPTEIAIAAKGIAAAAQIAGEADDADSRAIAAALAAGDAVKADGLYAAVSASHQRDHRMSGKKAANAERGRAALARLTNVRKAAEFHSAAAALEPDDIATWREAGLMWEAAGNLSEARRAYEGGLAAAERAQNVWWRGALSDSLGGICEAEGKLDQALDFYRNGEQVAEKLSRADPTNSGLSRDVSVSLDKIADVLGQQGQLDQALKNYSAARDIRERLAKADPTNSGLSRDVSYSHDQLGRLHEKLGDMAKAREHARLSLEVDERLSGIDPTNATWQKDVEVSRARMRQLG